MLPPLPRGATPHTTLHTIGLPEFEAQIANESDEVAAAFDGEGRLVLAPRRGTPISVRFFPEEVERLRGAIVTHVHPLGGPFSGADAKFASDNGLAEMRVVLPNGAVYSMKRPPQDWPPGVPMRMAAERCVAEIEREAERRQRQGLATISPKEYERLTFESQRDAFGEIGVTIEKERWR